MYIIKVINGMGESLWVRHLRGGNGFQVGTKRLAMKFPTRAAAELASYRFRPVVKGTQFTIVKIK
jgi:hypothetical protein